MAGPRLRNKICLVTGAAQGIGLSIAQRFAGEGAEVLAADLRFTDVDNDTFGVTRMILDVTDEAAVNSLAADRQDIDVLVNCVGYVSTGTVIDTPLDDFDRSLDLNVRSVFLTIRAFLPAMVARSRGSIINIGSVVSNVMAAPDRLAYGSSKAAVVGLTMSVARDFITQGIRCNVISPGTVQTPSLEQRFKASGDPEAARRAFVARQPMGRLGQADEIAATALLLASDEAMFMTGSNIIIDGGMSL